MISKELLSKVLDIDSPDHVELTYGSNYENNVKQSLLLSYNDGSEPITINIYELAHKCKEWLHNIGFTFKIEFSKKDVSLMFYGPIKNPYHVADTELEVVFQACERALKLKAKND